MSVITAARRTYKDSGNTTDVYCMRIVLATGAIYRFTDGINDLVMEFKNNAGVVEAITPVTYLSDYGLDLSAFGGSSSAPQDIDVDGMLGYLAMNRIQIASGFFNKAKVFIFATSWADPVEDDEKFFGGYFGEVTVSGGRYKLKLKSQMDALNVNTTRYYTLLCDEKFGGVRCGVDLDPAVWVAKSPTFTLLSEIDTGTNTQFNEASRYGLTEAVVRRSSPVDPINSLNIRSLATWTNSDATSWSTPDPFFVNGLAQHPATGWLFIAKSKTGDLTSGGGMTILAPAQALLLVQRTQNQAELEIVLGFANYGSDVDTGAMCIDETTGDLYLRISNGTLTNHILRISGIGTENEDFVADSELINLGGGQGMAPAGVYGGFIWYWRTSSNPRELWRSKKDGTALTHITQFPGETNDIFFIDPDNGFLYAAHGVNLRKYQMSNLEGYTAIDPLDFRVGDTVKPSVQSGYWWRCTVGGQSGTTEPVWPGGGTVTDGEVTWTAMKALRLDVAVNVGGGTDSILNLTTSLLAGFEDHFLAGDVEVLTGENAGHTRRILTNSLTNIVVDSPYPYAFTGGDTVRVTAGCQKRRLDDCDGKYQNVRNFQGFDKMPGYKNIFARGIS